MMNSVAAGGDPTELPHADPLGLTRCKATASNPNGGCVELGRRETSVPAGCPLGNCERCWPPLTVTTTVPFTVTT